MTSTSETAQESRLLHHIDEPGDWRDALPIIFVRGWCFHLHGPRVVAVRARTGQDIHRGVHGIERPDVAAAFGNPPGSLASGFALQLVEAPERSTAVFEALLESGEWVEFASRPVGLGESTA